MSAADYTTVPKTNKREQRPLRIAPVQEAPTRGIHILPMIQEPISVQPINHVITPPNQILVAPVSNFNPPVANFSHMMPTANHVIVPQPPLFPPNYCIPEDGYQSSPRNPIQNLVVK